MATSKPAMLRPTSSRPAPNHPYPDNHGGVMKTTQNRSTDYGSKELKGMSDHNNTMNQKGNHFMRKTLGKTQTIQGLEKKIKKDLELG